MSEETGIYAKLLSAEQTMKVPVMAREEERKGYAALERRDG
jgi:hypothetical protein